MWKGCGMKIKNDAKMMISEIPLCIAQVIVQHEELRKCNKECVERYQAAGSKMYKCSKGDSEGRRQDSCTLPK